MVTSDSSAKHAAVSVIVPARNEEACLAACLQSFLHQTGIEFELIVVDDGSTDRTREIAKSFPKVRLLEAGHLPPGWTGKNNALTVGAKAAVGAWLLFTDADTVHLPGSLARSVAEARERGVVFLSYSPEQDVRGFWEMAVMPVIFAELAATYRPSSVSDPKSPAAAANGQYILVRRQDYDAVGGHTAVAASLLEDVALARAVKASGRKIFFRYGADAVRTRMYRSFSQLVEGWTKNLALLFPDPARLAVLRLLEFVLIATSGTAAVVLGLAGRPRAAIFPGLLFVILTSLFAGRIRKAHFSWISNAVAVLGLPVFSYLLLRSGDSCRKGRVNWKGRPYPFGPEAVGSELRNVGVNHVLAKPE